MKNPRDMKQSSILASQIMPKNSKFFNESFKDCTEKPWSYMLIDVSQQCPDMYRLRSNIFPTDFPRNIIYIKK